jgi:hypothetical protein
VDDIRAARAHDQPAQERAEDLSFQLAAHSEIERRVTGVRRMIGQHQELGQERGKRIHDVVHFWAPIVSHYIDSFDDSYDSMADKLRVQQFGGVANVLYDVVHDPSQTDPAKQQRATLHIELVKEKASSGSGEFWRVAKIGYLGRGEAIPAVPGVVPRITPPATAPS